MNELFGMIEPTITLGNIIEIGSIIAGGLAVLITLKNNVAVLKSDVAGMQKEIQKIGEILVKMADLRGEIGELRVRVTAAEKDIRELRHGEGFIRGNFNRSIDGEYP